MSKIFLQFFSASWLGELRTAGNIQGF